MRREVWATASSAVLRGLLQEGEAGEAPVKVCQNTNQSITFTLLHLKSSRENQVLPQALRPVS